MDINKILEYQKKDFEIIKLERQLDNNEDKKIYQSMVNVVKTAQNKSTSLEKEASDILQDYKSLEKKYNDNLKSCGAVLNKKLDTYLTGSLMRYFAEYMSDYQLLCQCNKDGFTPYSEIAEIQTDVEYDIKRIDKRFSSTKCLNMAYEWCMVFEGALERDKAVSEGAKVSSDTQEKPKVYGKK